MEKKEKNWIGSGREGKYRDGVGEWKGWEIKGLAVEDKGKRKGIEAG